MFYLTHYFFTMADVKDRHSIADDGKDGADELVVSVSEADSRDKKPLSKRMLGIIWDTLDKTPEERKFMGKVDTWIMS